MKTTCENEYSWLFLYLKAKDQHKKKNGIYKSLNILEHIKPFDTKSIALTYEHF